MRQSMNEYFCMIRISCILRRLYKGLFEKHCIYISIVWLAHITITCIKTLFYTPLAIYFWVCV